MHLPVYPTIHFSKQHFGPGVSRAESVVSAMTQFQFDCRDLAEEWDSNADVRSRIRGGGSLVKIIQKSKDASINQCVGNMDVLLPMVHRLYACGRKLPEVPRLREECAKVYSLASKVATEDMVDDDSWELRKLLRFVKRKAQREEVTQEPCFCYAFLWYRGIL